MKSNPRILPIQRVLALAFIVITTTASRSPAQAPSPTPAPKEPILRRAPASASWTIQIESALPPADPTQPPPRIKADGPQKIVVVKTGHVYWEQVTFRSGKKSERWIQNKTELQSDPDSGEVTYVPPSENGTDDHSDHFSFKSSDFQGLEWLSLKTYKGMKKHGDKDAYYFELTAPQSTGASDKKSFAFLATETQMPLFASNGWLTYIYTYNPPPTTPLVPPERFMKVFRQLEVDLNEIHRAPGVPSRRR